MTDLELRRELKQAFDEIRVELRALQEMFETNPELFEDSPELEREKENA